MKAIFMLFWRYKSGNRIKSVMPLGIALFMFCGCFLNSNSQAKNYDDLTGEQKHTWSLILQKNANWQSRLNLIWLNPEQKSDESAEYHHIFSVLSSPEAQIQKLSQSINIPIADKADEKNFQAQCLYPARFWYVAHINNMPINWQNCPALTEFLVKAPADSIKLIFADEDYTNPASMLGHVFLTLEGLDENKISRKNNVSFILPIENDGVLPILWLYAQAISSGKKGLVTLKPFAKDREYYIYGENRNIWEIELTTDPERVKLIQFMIWEMRHTPLIYHFFTNNCASFIEYLMELSDAKFDAGSLYTTPLRVIKNADSSQLVDKVNLHPNRHWQKNIGDAAEIIPQASPLHNLNESQVGLAYGIDGGRNYLEIGFAPIARDLSDPINILSHNSKLVLGKLNLRTDIRRKNLRINEFTLFQMGNYVPYHKFNRFSFEFNLGYGQLPDKYLHHHGAYHIDFIYGANWQLHPDIEYYALLGGGGLATSDIASIKGKFTSGFIINQIFASKSVIQYNAQIYTDKLLDYRQSMDYTLQFNGFENHHYGIKFGANFTRYQSDQQGQIFYNWRF